MADSPLPTTGSGPDTDETLGKSRVAVLGGTGFVGGHIVEALTRRGHCVDSITAPRLPPCRLADLDLAGWDTHVAALAAQLHDCDVVVNAAGLATPTGHELGVLLAANAALPAVVGAATGGRRLIHVSSGAVQGNSTQLDSRPASRGFSPYSHSKVLGELALSQVTGAVVYRPPGVHGKGRATTATTVRLARSRYASVAEPGDQNSPVALVENVADAVAYLATCEQEPPQIVHHPSEGITVGLLMHLLGDKPPRLLPTVLARGLCGTAAVAGRFNPWVAANARRLEVLWFGQEQAPSWLDEAGWTPYRQPHWWRAMAQEMTGP